MKLLGYDDFGAMRLSEFLPSNRIREDDNYEFMGCVWLGEMCRFTCFLRLMAEPRIVRAISLHFSDIPEPVAQSVLSRIGLKVAPDMTPDNVRSILGAPIETARFTADSVSHHFLPAAHPRYDVHCIFHEPQGLVAVDILRPDYKEWRVAAGRLRARLLHRRHAHLDDRPCVRPSLLVIAEPLLSSHGRLK